MNIIRSDDYEMLRSACYETPYPAYHTGLAGVKVTSSDKDIVSVYDNNENYEEISSVSGDKVGTGLSLRVNSSLGQGRLFTQKFCHVM